MTTQWRTIEDYDAAYRKLARDKEAQIMELRARVRGLEKALERIESYATKPPGYGLWTRVQWAADIARVALDRVEEGARP